MFFSGRWKIYIEKTQVCCSVTSIIFFLSDDTSIYNTYKIKFVILLLKYYFNEIF